MKKRTNTSKKPEADSPRARRSKEERMRFLRQNTWLVLLAVLILVAVILFICVLAGGSPQPSQTDKNEAGKTERYVAGYICADTASVAYYDAQLNEVGTVARGTQITYCTDEVLDKGGVRYYLTYFDSLRYGYLASDAITTDASKVVGETTVYVRTPQNLRIRADGPALGKLVEQGTELPVVGYDYLEDGVVHLYEVRYGGQTGYISGQYTASTLEAATEVYDRFGVYSVHAGRGDPYGGGDAGSLDYYPREKANFEDNVMPVNCYSLYLTCDPEVIGNVEKYIEYAKSTKINAFVVNIMDGTSVGYPSKAYLEYSPTAYEYANNTLEEYQAAIRKIKDAGFYCIGRLTTFNDSFFVSDHPEYAISDASGDPLYIANSYWPSAFCRYVWEYKVELAKEAVETMGFDEIQFDYVRFPDGTYQYESSGNINYHNEYDETKAQAIQRFLMYATDELHDAGVYVGADVFGETCGTYVTSYGQYWPAISNVVDVISGMPYPDHFTQNGSYRPWEHPYDTILDWATSAAKRQSETPSPAVARTWIQAYDAIRYPYNTYGAEEVGAEIQALIDGGLTGGFMTWNAACNLNKLESFRSAFDALE